MYEKHHARTLESQRTRRSNLTRTSQTKPALRHHQTGRRLRRPTAAQAGPNLVLARTGTPHRRGTLSLPRQPLHQRRRARPRLHGPHQNCTTSCTKNSASWTPSPSLNTPTTTTTNTTASTTHTPKKSHHGRHKMPYDVDQHQQPVHVNDVQLGTATECSCTACRQPISAKHGDELYSLRTHRHTRISPHIAAKASTMQCSTTAPIPSAFLAFAGCPQTQSISKMNCPSGTNRSSRWTQSSPSYWTKSLSQNQTPPS